MAALSRTPSPAASGSDSDSVVATPLTPRSKLKALFATIGGASSSESGSDDEKENASPSRSTKKSKKTKTPKKSPRPRTSPRQSTHVSPTIERATSPNSSSSDGDSEDNDTPIRPHGRFAARMLGDSSAKQHPPATTAPAPSAPIPEGETARDRVKRMLGQQNTDADSREDRENDAEDEDDDDVPVVARSRKLVNRPTRHSASPRQASAAPPSREASPGIFMTPTKVPEREDSPMFVTPTKTGAAGAGGADLASSASKPGRNARFQALVARKREEARAREEEEARKRAARLEAAQAIADADDDLLMGDGDEDDDVSDITDDEGGRKLTQDVAAARPSRKASKKALEEMHRETQRMSRNLQLAHEAKTKKKITKASLFERFNFRPQGASTAVAAATETVADAPTSSSRPTSPASPQNHTDSETRNADTPPSSPPVLGIDKPCSPSKAATTATVEPPAPEAAPAARLDKGKGKAVETKEEEAKPRRQVRVRMPVQTNLVMVDSDDELEIVQTAKNKLDAMFDNVPLKREQEPRSMMALRRLAQIGSPGKKGRKTKDANALTQGQLHQLLQEWARRQAKLEREQRVELLRSKGITIQTEEEREKEMEEIDDIVERARREAEEIMEREKEDAKKERKEKGEDGGDDVVDPLAWDDSEDEEGGGDYVPEEEREIELSGSDEEDEEEDEEDADKEKVEGALIDDEADSAEESEDGKPEEAAAPSDHEVVPEVQPTPTQPRKARRRTAVVISDDEDDAVLPAVHPHAGAKTPGPKPAVFKSPFGQSASKDSPQMPTSVLRSATKNFIPGLPVALGSPAGMGLTQIFAGTLGDDSQLSGSPGGFNSPSQPMPTLGNFAEINASQDAAKATTARHDLILSSQPTQDWLKQVQAAATGEQDSGTPSQAVQLDFSQSQMHGLDSLLRDADASQISGLMDSQDTGPLDNTPLKVRFIEHQPSTIGTVILGQTQTQTQMQMQMQLTSVNLAQLPPSQSQSQSSSHVPSQPQPPHKRTKLFRKADMANIEEEAEEADDEDNTAFEVMKEAAAHERKHAAAAAAFDRKKSKAKDMVEEQAEESEDEYAGLGGADGEDSDDESLASVKDIIDDNQKLTDADNAKLAAFYADRERESDEKQVQKLFRDVTTGMLRRKRGADYDLSDSDDGGEARRRMKRRQFAKMQKALFADERISKVAENPKNQAFLRTIEDRGSDDEMDFIFDHEAAGAPAASSTTGSTTPTVAAGAEEAPTDSTAFIPDSQTAVPAAVVPDAVADRRATRRNQSASGKKPSNLGDIRQSLSHLLDDDDGTSLSVVADTEFGSGEENAHDHEPSSSNKENRRPGHGSVHVVDRISLKRGNSNASAAGSRTAFDTGLGSGLVGPTGFKVPALLRRATTNSLISTSSTSSRSGGGGGGGGSHSSSGNGGNGAFADQGKIKKNASKRSGINYFARENERRAAVAESEKRRQAKKVRSAEGRSRVVGGLFGSGKFE